MAPNFAASATEVQPAASFNKKATFENGTWAPLSNVLVSQNVVSTIPTGGAHAGTRYGKWTTTLANAGVTRYTTFNLDPGRRINIRVFIKSPPPLTAAFFIFETKVSGVPAVVKVIQNGTQAGWSSFTISWYNDTGVVKPVQVFIGANNGTGFPEPFSFSLDDIRVWDSP